MNNLTNQSIINANKQTYLSLLVSVEAGVGMLQIFIAVCDADRQRENIIANYEQELAPNYNIYRVYLDSQEPSLKQAITQQVTLTENAIAIVLGAETLGSFNQNESLKKFFGYLQWTREALRELKMPIILWIPSRIYNQIPKQAPDFWSWRNGVFHFQPELSFVQPALLFNQSRGIIQDNQEGSVFSPEQLEASLAEAIQQWGADSSKTEVLYSQLGTLYAERVESAKSTNRQKELILAQEYLEKAIVLQTKFQKLEALATSLNNLANLYYNQGKYSEAEPLYLDALEMTKRLFTGDHPDVASSLNNLALLYHNQGKYSEAEPLYLDALEMIKRLFTCDHPYVASSLNNLAYLYDNQGRYSEAEPLYLDALEMTKRLFTGDHPYVATSLNNLALLYNNQGRYSEAEPLYLDALEMRKRLFTGDHPYVASSLNNLASLYDSQGKYSEAKPLYLDALAMSERTLGANHPNTITVRNNLRRLQQQMTSF
jgi:tetratricopeptide (TPR) repeat protein